MLNKGNSIFLQFSKKIYSLFVDQTEENQNALLDKWSIVPSKLYQGDILTIEGKTKPGENIGIKVSFSLYTPAIDKKYKYKFDNVCIPGGGNSFLVRSQKVDNLDFIVHMFVDFKRSFDADNGIAEFFEKNIPAGNYEITIQGNALDDEKEIKLDFIASQTIRADENGNFYYQYDTGSLPDGDFKVLIGGNEKIINLMSSKSE